MTLKKMIISLFLILPLIASCTLFESGDSYNNDYARDWFRKTAETATTFDSLKMAMSDKKFTAAKTTLNKSNFTGDDYKGFKKGIIDKLGNTLTITVSEVYIDATERWYSKEEYYNYLVNSIHLSPSAASAAANDNFYSKSVSYSIASSPKSLILGLTGDGDLFGTFYETTFEAIKH